MSDNIWRNEDWRSLENNSRSKHIAAATEKVDAVVARRIPKDFNFDENNLKPLTRVLWSLSVAMAHLLDGYDKFSKIKSAKISPDGLLGGHGYVRSIVDIRRQISEAQELVSSLVDTIHDEINGPHWKAELANLLPSEVVQIEEMVSDSEGFFKASVLEACTLGSGFKLELKGEPTGRYILGVDPNQGGNAKCGAVIIKLGF